MIPPQDQIVLMIQEVEEVQELVKDQNVFSKQDC